MRKKAASRKKLTGVDDIEIRVQRESPTKSPSRSSIYINPNFKGDLNELKGKPGNQSPSKEAHSRNFPLKSNNLPSGLSTIKHRTILKIVKDKHGNVISRSKVNWLKLFNLFNCYYSLIFSTNILVVLAHALKRTCLYLSTSIYTLLYFKFYLFKNNVSLYIA